MPKNIDVRKMTDIRLPSVDKAKTCKEVVLPFNGHAVKESGFSFSFACFDRKESLFNLGSNSTDDGAVKGMWFVALLDCLKSVSNMTIPEMRSSLHDLHPIDWRNANVRCPNGAEQFEYWQFRINKGNGRVIGFITQRVFYVVWLDPYHNLIDSDGYERATRYKTALSEYEALRIENEDLKRENEWLKRELDTANELMGKETD